MEDKLRCSFVIKIYELDTNDFMARSTIPYAEIHRVMTSEGQRVLSSGTPLSEEFFRSMFFFKNIEEGKHAKISIFEEHLLYHGFNNGTEYIIWWRKAGKELMDFSKGFQANLKPGEYPVPPLVFILKNRKQLLLYALKQNKRPGMTTKIYHPPFPNIYINKTLGTSNICMGSSRIETNSNDSVQSVIEKAEVAWWRSEFNQHLGDSSLKKHKDLIEAKKTGKFPINSLIDTKKWLRDVF